MLPVSSHGRPSVCVCVLVASYEDASHVGSGPTLVTSRDLNHLFKDLVSKYSHILRYVNLEEDTFKPITLPPSSKGVIRTAIQ